MNAGEMVPLFVGLLTARRWDQVTQRTPTHLRLTGSTTEREELQVWCRTPPTDGKHAGNSPAATMLTHVHEEYVGGEPVIFDRSPQSRGKGHRITPECGRLPVWAVCCARGLGTFLGSGLWPAGVAKCLGLHPKGMLPAAGCGLCGSVEGWMLAA